MIKIRSLCKNHVKKNLLNEINLNLGIGDFCVLVGNNNSGKSTLLKIIAGLTTPTSGTCLIADRDTKEDNPEIKSQIALIDEKINFEYQGNLDQFLRFYQSFYKEWDDELLQELFNKKVIHPTSRFKDLSSIQKMQFVLAVFLARRPKILLVDEVSACLDHDAKIFFWEKLKDYCVKNKGLVLVAINLLREVDNIATKVLMINNDSSLLFDHETKNKNMFIKIRKPLHSENPIFHQKECVWLNRNSDGSSSYILRKEFLQNFSMEGILEDKRVVSFSEIITYFTIQTRNENVSEAA